MAMLALSYIRLYHDLDPHRQLQFPNPAQIATTLGRCPPVGRSGSVV
jgi:hypothetical protein